MIENGKLLPDFIGVSDARNICQADKQHRQIGKVLGVVIHRCTVDEKIENVAQFYHQWESTGKIFPYTFWIGPDAKVHQCLDTNKVGWHARSHSKRLLGIAVHQDMRITPPTDKQMHSLAVVIALLQDKFEFGPSGVRRHDDLAYGSLRSFADCPGPFFRLDELNIKVLKVREQIRQHNEQNLGFSL